MLTKFFSNRAMVVTVAVHPLIPLIWAVLVEGKTAVWAAAWAIAPTAVKEVVKTEAKTAAKMEAKMAEKTVAKTAAKMEEMALDRPVVVNYWAAASSATSPWEPAALFPEAQRQLEAPP